MSQNDVYINDLASVEYGSGTEFTLTFDQVPPIQLSAVSPNNRDEIVWNILTVRQLWTRCGHVFVVLTPCCGTRLLLIDQ